MAESALSEAPNPIARVAGAPFFDLPRDLYIPPDALEVFLERFEGPLDLLLYLIKRENLDILDIPIAEVTRQYMEYIRLMDVFRLELAADYLVMAALLTEIKSRLLIPRPKTEEDEIAGEEVDPRAELARRLREYEQIRQGAEDLDALPRLGRDLYLARAEPMLTARPRPEPKVEFADLIRALQDVMRRSERLRAHQITQEPLSVRERMTRILEALQKAPRMAFVQLFLPQEGRRGIVVSFLAILELARERLIELQQEAAFAPIFVSACLDQPAIPAAVDSVPNTEVDSYGEAESQEKVNDPAPARSAA